MHPLVNIYGVKSQFIVEITHEAKRWESMPNRREPLTKDMVKFIINKFTTLNLPDGKYAVMTDCFIIALQAGFHRMEWSQDATKLATTKSFQYNIHG